MANPAGLTSLDVACSLPLGTNRGPGVPPVRRGVSVREAVEQASLLGFGNGPCYVAFTGGPESAMALAVATDVARRYGHEDPVPITLRYPGLFSAEEHERQERVIAHLRLADWERVEVTEDLSLIGPVVTRTLRELGLLWPTRVHTMAPLLERARGGTFVFTRGTSDLFAFWRWAPLAAVLAGERRPARRDLALLGATLAPARLRAKLARRRGAYAPMPWLHPAAERRALAMLAGRGAAIPLRFDRAVLRLVTHRCFEATRVSFQALGEAIGTRVVLPFSSATVIAAFASVGGWRGAGSRRAALTRLTGDLLPPGMLVPPKRHDTREIFFGETSRAFGAEWSGEGLDESLVDPQLLRRIWLHPRPDPRTDCLLQLAWLHDTSRVKAHEPAPEVQTSLAR